MLHPSETLDYYRDAVQGPQLPDEPIGGGAFQQGLLDGGELLIRQAWRRAAGFAAAQRLGATLLPAGVSDTYGLRRHLELAGNLGLTDAGGEQLGPAQPTGLEPVTFSLCRRAARNRWHRPDPRLIGWSSSNSSPQPTTPHGPCRRLPVPSPKTRPRPGPMLASHRVSPATRGAAAG
jgi:hypothetical protein